MTQKELNYIEDIYNHEVLIVKELEHTEGKVSDIYRISKYLDSHKLIIKELNKLLEDNI